MFVCTTVLDSPLSLVVLSTLASQTVTLRCLGTCGTSSVPGLPFLEHKIMQRAGDGESAGGTGCLPPIARPVWPHRDLRQSVSVASGLACGLPGQWVGVGWRFESQPSLPRKRPVLLGALPLAQVLTLLLTKRETGAWNSGLRPEPGPGRGGQGAVTPGREPRSPAAVHRLSTALCGVFTAGNSRCGWRQRGLETRCPSACQLLRWVRNGNQQAGNSLIRYCH